MEKALVNPAQPNDLTKSLSVQSLFDNRSRVIIVPTIIINCVVITDNKGKNHHENSHDSRLQELINIQKVYCLIRYTAKQLNTRIKALVWRAFMPQHDSPRVKSQGIDLNYASGVQGVESNWTNGILIRMITVQLPCANTSRERPQKAKIFPRQSLILRTSR